MTVFYRPDLAATSMLDCLMRTAAEEGAASDSVAMTVIRLDPGATRPAGAAHRGSDLIYPASVCKLFYAVAVQAWLQAGRLKPGHEIDRALCVMLRESSNDATNFLLDCLTETTSGPELPEQDLTCFVEKRRAIGRYFAFWQASEFQDIVLTQKTWEDGPYGREWQSRYAIANNRNLLTTDAVARLLWALDRGQAVTPVRDAAVLQLLRRDGSAARLARRADNQIEGFLGQGLPANAALWSKAGWTSDSRHDAAIVQWSDGARWILSIFSQGPGNAANARLLPALAEAASDWIRGNGTIPPRGGA